MTLSLRLAALAILSTCVIFATEARGVIITEESDAPPISMPHEKLECKSCHKSHSMLAPEESNAPCVDCHEKQTGKDSHPTGVAYEGAEPPGGLPLSKDNKLTCGTCHLLHKTEAPDPPRALLRKKFNVLCKSCHYPDKKSEEPPTSAE